MNTTRSQVQPEPAVEVLGENAEAVFIFNCGQNQVMSEDTNVKKQIGTAQGVREQSVREFKGHSGVREFTRLQGRKGIYQDPRS